MRKVGILISDTHGGSLLGLLHPDTKLPEQTVKLNEGQEYLWELHQYNLAEAKKFIGKSDCFIIHDGDVTQGTKRSKELVSTRMADHILIAEKILGHTIKSFGKNLKAVRVARGTGSHVFEEGSSEILITEMIKQSNPSLNISCVYHGELDLGTGQTVDYAHHGPGVGNRSWLRGNELRFYLRDRMMSSLMKGQMPSTLYVRGHFHNYRHEMLEVEDATSHITLLPSMCLIDDFSRQAVRSPECVTNGMVLAEFVDGVVNIHPLIRTLDFRTKDTL